MKKIFVLLFVLFLIPTMVSALMIGDIDFRKVPWKPVLFSELVNESGGMLRIHPYPDDNIKIIVILCEPYKNRLGAWILEVSYIKNDELFVYRPNIQTREYRRVAIFKDGEEEKIKARVLDSMKYLG